MFWSLWPNLHYWCLPPLHACSRFLINLSGEEKRDPIKLCTYIELAHWYYLDLMRPEDAALPACSLKEFMAACV